MRLPDKPSIAAAICPGPLIALLLLSVSVGRAQESLTVDAKRQYTDPASCTWCVTVAARNIGADGREWTWISIEADPRRILHLPTAELSHAEGYLPNEAYRLRICKREVVP